MPSFVYGLPLPHAPALRPCGCRTPGTQGLSATAASIWICAHHACTWCGLPPACRLFHRLTTCHPVRPPVRTHGDRRYVKTYRVEAHAPLHTAPPSPAPQVVVGARTRDNCFEPSRRPSHLPLTVTPAYGPASACQLPPSRPRRVRRPACGPSSARSPRHPRRPRRAAAAAATEATAGGVGPCACMRHRMPTTPTTRWRRPRSPPRATRSSRLPAQ